MGLLEKLKSLFGSDEKRQSSGSRRSEPEVTVEREPSAESEHAVKGTDGATVATGGGETAAGGTASGGSDGHEEPATPEPPAEVGESGSDGTTGEADSDGVSEESGSESPDDEAASGGSAPVSEIKGIGPTYTDRLGEAGIETVADLAAAEIPEVADAAKTGETRAANWIERAQDF